MDAIKLYLISWIIKTKESDSARIYFKVTWSPVMENGAVSEALVTAAWSRRRGLNHFFSLPVPLIYRYRTAVIEVCV